MSGSNLPSSFASAAAGQNSSRDRNSGRGDSRGSSSSNWLRDGRPNGSVILRRASTTPFNNNSFQANQNPPSVASDHQLAMNDPPPSTNSSMFPHQEPASNHLRYSKEDLLGLAEHQVVPDGIDINSLMMPGFQPGGFANGNSSRPWAKSHDTNGTNDPTVCWDTEASSGPLGREAMSAEDQEFHFNDVNSPLKQPQQQNQQIRDGGQGPTINGRKQSTIQGLASPSGSSRPGARRRETTDSPFGTLASPSSAGPRPFDSSWLGGRKNIESKETEPLDEEKPQNTAHDQAAKSAGFPSLARNNTTGGTIFPVTAGWSANTITPTASAFSAFGNFALNSPTVPDKSFASGTTGSRFFSAKQEPDAAATTANPIADPNSSWRPRPRTDTDPFGGDEAQGLSGSAALGGARDTSPPPIITAHGSQIFDTPLKGAAGDFGMSGLALGGSRVASPSQTNPYRSPLGADRGDNDHDDSVFDRGHVSGGPSEVNSAFNTMRSGFPPAAAFEGSDRSQTSSVAVGTKNYPPLSNITGWPTAFTPDRERTGFGGAFGNSVFSPMTNEVQSPGGLGAMGGGIFGSTGAGLGASTAPVRGASKLGSLFPPAMQAQMHNPEHDPLAGSVPDTYRQPNPLSAVGAGPIGAQARDTDSPISMGRGMMGLGSVYNPQPQANTPGNFTTAEQGQSLLATAPQSYDYGAAPQGPPFTAEQGAPGMPKPPSRSMVMPDRMRWRYLDPQGIAQGPFTGLQMNQWYKEQFFSTDLRVRKEEDVDFEPLGQLIRRIGNSREPFLVPQVGIAHGPSPQPVSMPTGGDNRMVVPPLLGVVPSYGKTLTAEEQNNLERRKQEDQQAQARQREYNMTQQAHQPLYRGVHPSGIGGLQHQVSMHSLNSQPSYGSISSPIGMPTQGPIGGAIGGGPAGFFDPPSALNRGPSMPNALNAGMDHHRGDYHEQERQLLASIHGPGGVSGMFPPQPVGPPTTDLKSQLPAVDQLERDPQGFKDRLKEFQDYQGIGNQQRPGEEYRTGPSRAGRARDVADNPNPFDTNHEIHGAPAHLQSLPSHSSEATISQEMTLTEQVQKAQAANRQHEDPWSRQTSAIGLPMPFPAPHASSATPIAAPTAQRRTHLADHYIETRSNLSETPDSSNRADSANAQPPPLAPWARDPGTESLKQPSLRDIQESEARVRAKQDAERRAQQELEALHTKEREKINPIVPGLPVNSTWGNGSPAPSAPSPWSKPSGVKAGAVGVVPSASGTNTPSSKKTLADIQKEEEARKRREAKEQLATPGVAATPGYGKRYADLASKTGPPGMMTNMAAAAAANAATNIAAGWSTVGAGGKVKIPTGPQAQTRAASATARAPAPQAVQQSKPVATMASKTTVPDALSSLRKWIKMQLTKNVTDTVQIDETVELITAMGHEKTVIESILYEAFDHKSVLNPIQLAEEYVRRRRDADKGIFEPPTEPKGAGGSSGWSEVAKKSGGQPKDNMQGAEFKVVRKKAKK